jgi:hypothetical protein
MDSTIIYRIVLILLLLLSPSYAIEFKGKFLQGHFILGITDPNANILIGKKKIKVSKDGDFVFGIDRDQKYDLTFTKILNGEKIIITKKVTFKELMGLKKVRLLHQSQFTKELKKKIMQ